MSDKKKNDYVVIVQCHIVKEHCSGYLCEKAFHERGGGFSGYPLDKEIRTLTLTCGGCCGRALHRKLCHLMRKIKKKEGIEKERIAVQLSSCITQDNFHAPPCPHLGYLKALIAKLGLDVYENTYVSVKAEERRRTGIYAIGKTPSECAE